MSDRLAYLPSVPIKATNPRSGTETGRAGVRSASHAASVSKPRIPARGLKQRGSVALRSYDPSIKATNPRSGTETGITTMQTPHDAIVPLSKPRIPARGLKHMVSHAPPVSLAPIKATNPRSGTETDARPTQDDVDQAATYQSHESPLGD